MFTGPQPKITQAQLVAIAGWIVAQLVAFNLVDGRSSQLAISITATALAAALKIADSIIRHGRSRALAPTAAVVAPLPPKAVP